MKTTSPAFLFYIYLLLVPAFTFGQSARENLAKVSALVQEQGSLFIAVDQPQADSEEICLQENEISNRMHVANDSIVVDYVNHTELFCEVYILRTHFTYRAALQDIDPQAIRLVENKYNYGKGKLKEGPAGWYEVQLFTKGKQALVEKADLESRQTEFVPAFNLIFQTKEGAKTASALLKSALRNAENR